MPRGAPACSKISTSLIARQRRLRGRLHHHRVAGAERRGDGRAQQGVGEVPGRNHGPDAVGAQHAGVLIGRHQPPHLPHVAPVRAQLVGVIRVEIGGLLDLAQRLDPVLPHLEDEPGGELEPALAHDGGGAVEQRGALLPGGRAPRREGGLGGGDRVAHVIRRRRRHARHDRAGVGRAAALDRRRARARLARDVQRVGPPELALHLGDRRGERRVERRVVSAEADVCDLPGASRRSHRGPRIPHSRRLRGGQRDAEPSCRNVRMSVAGSASARLRFQIAIRTAR